MWNIYTQISIAKNWKITNPIRPLSSESASFISRLKNKITGNSSTPSNPNYDERYAKQISKMAHAEKWTIQQFHDQIKETTGGWRSKIPGLGDMDAMKQMNATQSILEATIDVLGNDSSAVDLKEMSKKQKLQISLRSGESLKDINVLVGQFESMEVMHQILRYRVERGKSLPLNEEDAKVIMQTDAKEALPERVLKDMKRQRMKAMKQKNLRRKSLH